jgi:hypothetical protein
MQLTTHARNYVIGDVFRRQRDLYYYLYAYWKDGKDGNYHQPKGADVSRRGIKRQYVREY